ncbi:MAG TPA: type II toxin-antitoxin system VapC family toxin [Mucilaginibacter sp.]|jgi:PIN domain nuclease of toxin-antitoxin system
MRFLIDTHVLIWYLDGNKRLPGKIRDLINDGDNLIVISIASLWEFAIKISLKKIDTKINLPDIEAYLIEREFNLLSISFKHLNALSALPTHHGDPFDRLLIAQALTEDLTIISADKEFQAYPVRVIW